MSSGWSWTSGDTTALRVQYPHVLFSFDLRSSWVSKCDGGRTAYSDGQLWLYDRRSTGKYSMRYRTTADDQIVDPFGRRRTMLYTIPVMAAALLLASVFFHRKMSRTPGIVRGKANDLGLTIPTGGILLNDPPEPYSPALASLVLISMLLFVAGYALGSGNIPWQQGELFRLEVRGVGTSICTAVNWYVHLTTI